MFVRTDACSPISLSDITMYETLLRPHEVHTPPPLRSVAEVAADLKQAALIREQKRLQQIAASDARRAQLAASGNLPAKKRKRGAVAPEQTERESGASALNEMTTAGELESKKPRREEGHGDVPAAASLDPDAESSALNENSTAPLHKTAAQPPTLSTALNVATSTSAPSEPEPEPADMDQAKEDLIAIIPEPPQELSLSVDEKGEKASVAVSSSIVEASAAPSKMMPVAKVLNEVRGHTSYLTFAALLPSAYEPSGKGEGVSVLSSTGISNGSSTTIVPASTTAAAIDDGAVREIKMADADADTSATDGVAPACPRSIES